MGLGVEGLGCVLVKCLVDQLPRIPIHVRA